MPNSCTPCTARRLKDRARAILTSIKLPLHLLNRAADTLSPTRRLAEGERHGSNGYRDDRAILVRIRLHGISVVPCRTPVRREHPRWLANQSPLATPSIPLNAPTGKKQDGTHSALKDPEPKTLAEQQRAHRPYTACERRPLPTEAPTKAAAGRSARR